MMMERPLILVTNDDGMFAPGIRALVEAVQPLGEVLVVAPDSPQSGKGHAITISEPLRLNKVHLMDGVESYECTGTPVDCVKLARHVLCKGRKVALCVSGINHGNNASINIIYSGTMSAAMEASLEGIPSIGFSLLDYSFEADFTAAKKYAELISRWVMQNNQESHLLLNVNIPKAKLNDIPGILVCRQADARWVEEFVESKDPRGVPYYWLTGKFVNMDQGHDTDVWALENNYVSVVPSKHDLTDYSLMPFFQGLKNQRI